jgi:hypothetical protein
VLEKAGRKQAAMVAYAETLAAMESLPEARRAAPAARQTESQARDAIARLAEGEDK